MTRNLIGSAADCDKEFWLSYHLTRNPECYQSRIARRVIKSNNYSLNLSCPEDPSLLPDE